MLNPNTPVFFKKLPATEDSKPNAIYLRTKGELNGETICEIEWHLEKWTVGRNEISTIPEALSKTAKKYHDMIEAGKVVLKKANPSLIELAKQLGMSTATLKRRMNLVKQHLVTQSA